MSRIREKATESEAVVRNITKDIQVLDLVKRNLIHSTTTLKRLQMLGRFAKLAHSILMLMHRSQCAHSIGGSDEREKIR